MLADRELIDFMSKKKEMVGAQAGEERFALDIRNRGSVPMII